MAGYGNLIDRVWKRLWLAMGMLINRVWREYGWLWEHLSTEYGESMAGYGKLIDRVWREYEALALSSWKTLSDLVCIKTKEVDDV